MKENLTNKILEVIKEGAVGTADVIVTFLETRYGATGGEMERKLAEVRTRRENFFEEFKNKQKFYALLSRLKRDGFILKDEDRWVVTKKGRKKLEDAKNRYEAKVDKTFKIIAFDIPEKKRRDRDWLRNVLPNLGFRFLQKSLWIGKVAIPERFMIDLQDRGILKNVDIFEITKTGTVSELN